MRPAVPTILLLLLASASAPAYAEQPAVPASGALPAASETRPIYRIDAPPGWAALPGQAERFAQGHAGSSPLGPRAATAQVAVWRSGSSGAALVVTWDHAPVSPSEPPPATPGPAEPGPATPTHPNPAHAGPAHAELSARAAQLIRQGLDHVRAQPRRAALAPGETELVAWDEAVRDNLAEGRLEWRHTRHNTSTLARTVLVHASSGTLHQVTAECMLGEDGKDLRSACESALAGLTITLPPAERMALGPLPAPAALDSSPASSAPAAGSPPALPSELQNAPKPDRVAPSFRDPGAAPPQGQILYARDPGGSDSDSKRRQWLFGIGGVLLAVAFYLTTRRRPDSERDSSDTKEEP